MLKNPKRARLNTICLERAIIKLGCEGTITGFDIDTKLQGQCSRASYGGGTGDADGLDLDDIITGRLVFCKPWMEGSTCHERSFALLQWTTLLPDVAVKPDTQNLFLIRDTDGNL